jgi:hypothetical protein
MFTFEERKNVESYILQNNPDIYLLNVLIDVRDTVLSDTSHRVGLATASLAISKYAC